MKAWRENIHPHHYVLSGRSMMAEFAADITAVHKKVASPEYQDAKSFFQRTYVTEGMRLLLTQVAERLSGRGGEPVIQLQTSFGGGNTYTLLAVYHLATLQCSVQDLQGIPDLLDKAGLMDVPQARVVVLDGTGRGPSEASTYSGGKVNTLWGELAWQLKSVSGAGTGSFGGGSTSGGTVSGGSVGSQPTGGIGAIPSPRIKGFHTFPSRLPQPPPRCDSSTLPTRYLLSSHPIPMQIFGSRWKFRRSFRWGHRIA